MWTWFLACSDPPPRPPTAVECRAWGGGDGVHLALTGDVVAVLDTPSATAEALAATIRTPVRDPCPGDALRWRRGTEGKPIVRACGSPPGATWKGAPVERVDLNLSDGSVWVDVYLPAAPFHLRGEAPFDRKVGLSGTQHMSLDWACLDCGPDGGRTTLGQGELELRWGFDGELVRDWSFQPE
jgi:hypothetical protein